MSKVMQRRELLEQLKALRKNQADEGEFNVIP